MDFGKAIEALKQGKKVTRKGWNGRGMFLYLKPATMVKAEWCHDPELKALCEANGGELLALGTICMYTHDSTGRNAILTGWLASQSDMLLEDWEIYKESNTDKSPSGTCGLCERSSLICDNDGHDLAYCHEDKKFRAPGTSACKWYKPLTIPEEEKKMSESRPRTIKDAATQMRQSVVEEAIKRLLTAAAETEAAIAYIFAINGDPECNADPDLIEGMTDVTGNLYGILSELRRKLNTAKM